MRAACELVVESLKFEAGIDFESVKAEKHWKHFQTFPDSGDPEIEAQNEMVKMGLSHFPKPSEAQEQVRGMTQPVCR